MLKRIHLSGMAGAGLLLLVICPGCRGGGGGSAGTLQAEEPADVKADRLRIQAGYAGSDACRSCHPAETATWERSRHQAIFKPGAKPSYIGVAPNQFDEEDLHVVTVMLPPATGADSEAPVRPAMNMVGRGAPGTFTVDAVIGGGRMESYATHLQDGSWLLLPLSYQVEQQAYKGYREGTCGAETLHTAPPRLWQSYERVWNHRCIDCHVTAGSIGFHLEDETYRTTYI
ncbi:MAG: hypothetical protein ACE5ID_09405, partial [Acidobacteriota bacterium]